jgi:hypothetical protein
MTENCAICGDRLIRDASATCHQCDRPFHLRLRNDADGKDCGEVWINEQYLSLEFACFECLGVGSQPSGQGESLTHEVRREPPVGSGH